MSTCANLVALKIDVECRTSWKYFVEPTVCYDSAARGTSSLRVAGRRRRSSFSCTRIRKRSRSSRKTFDSRKSDIRASRHSWDIYERGHDTHLVHQGVNDCWSKKVNERNSQRRARAAQVRAAHRPQQRSQLRKAKLSNTGGASRGVSGQLSGAARIPYEFPIERWKPWAKGLCLWATGHVPSLRAPPLTVGISGTRAKLGSLFAFFSARGLARNTQPPRWMNKTRDRE